MKHLLSIEQLGAKEIQDLLESAAYLKRQRGRDAKNLAGQTWAMIFTKSSTRTRVSLRGRHPRTRRRSSLFLSAERHPARPRRTDQGHRPRARPHGPRRHHPHLRPERRRRVRRILRHPHHQRPDRRRAPLPDPRRPAHHPGKARRLGGPRKSPSSATAFST